jgi:hypothetical protein
MNTMLTLASGWPSIVTTPLVGATVGIPGGFPEQPTIAARQQSSRQTADMPADIPAEMPTDVTADATGLHERDDMSMRNSLG